MSARRLAVVVVSRENESEQEHARRVARQQIQQLQDAAAREQACGFAYATPAEYDCAIFRAMARFRELLEGRQSAVRLSDADLKRCVDMLVIIGAITSNASCKNTLVATDAVIAPKVKAAKGDASLQTLLRKSMAAALEGEQ